MAVVLIACGLLLFYRKWVPAGLLAVISFLPVLLFGLYAQSQGSDFLPNSVMVKSLMPPLTLPGLYNYFRNPLPRYLFTGLDYNAIAPQRLLILLPLTGLLFYKQTAQQPAYRYVLFILTAAALLHVALIAFTWAPRYEAALVGCSAIICTTLVIKYSRWSLRRLAAGPAWIAIFIAVIVAGPLFLRGWHAQHRASMAAISIYDQQVQMGRFVRQYYDLDPIAFNDIGAISYYGHGHNLDLWGLADLEVARSMRKHYNTPGFLDSLSHQRHVKIAIVFEDPFRELLQRWTRVASWTIPYNNASYNQTVSFYAVDPAEAPRLASNLKQFQPSLPRGVEVTYY
jgi:hypothetical protein